MVAHLGTFQQIRDHKCVGTAALAPCGRAFFLPVVEHNALFPAHFETPHQARLKGQDLATIYHEHLD